ncbi:MAG: hypothetical protein JRF59_02025 [Deltaproteobacteria bacterium]|nr:hypothetical protein [Deltaproteobacteria bacterium]MBW1922521.1 hypothetical protein [Deltaproteobacteria bacterium]MBW1948378.1 hypothetical protein [Deltaproteobacteria bacterium]MBW2007117.1 hypothetical protein [Deltaproteobacteria bacterium]MBW2103268.1 hypothetical protein [Deltaproteobacteria bacterium]
MAEKLREKNAPDPMRLEVLRRLPKEIMEQLNKEEIKAFLYEDEWPDSLREKLKDYLE